MKSEQRWQKVGLVSVTFRKLWPDAAGPGVLALARSGPDPDPGSGPGPGRARPLPPSSGLEAGLPGRGELPPSQSRARGSAAAAIPARAADESRVRAAGERGDRLPVDPAVRAGLPTAPAATAQARARGRGPSGRGAGPGRWAFGGGA